MLPILYKLLAGELISAGVRKLFKQEKETNMFSEKSLFASKTVWGGIVAISASIANFWGIDVAADDQAQLIQLLTSVAGSIGGLVAIFGRIFASKTIK